METTDTASAPGGWLHLDIDATITIDHSDGQEKAAATWKKTFGLHPLLVFVDRPEIAGGEALAGLLRPGNAGSNTLSGVRFGDRVAVIPGAHERTSVRRPGSRAGVSARRVPNVKTHDSAVNTVVARTAASVPADGGRIPLPSSPWPTPGRNPWLPKDLFDD